MEKGCSRAAQDAAAQDRNGLEWDSAAQDPPRRPWPYPISLVALTVLWALVTAVYWNSTGGLSWGNCGPEGFLGREGYWHGAGYDSATAGAIVGGVLWAAAALASKRRPRLRGAILFAFLAVYVLALVVLWYAVAPSVYGPRSCSA